MNVKPVLIETRVDIVVEHRVRDHGWSKRHSVISRNLYLAHRQTRKMCILPDETERTKVYIFSFNSIKTNHNNYV